MTAAGHGGPNRNIFPIAAASASVAGQPAVRIFLNNRRPAFETSAQQTTRAHLPRSVAPEVTRPTDRRHSRAVFERREGRRSCGTHAASNGRPLGDDVKDFQIGGFGESVYLIVHRPHSLN